MILSWYISSDIYHWYFRANPGYACSRLIA